MLTVAELLAREDFTEAAIRRHGFVDYMRDYELLASGRDGAPHTDVHRYLFVGCAEAVYQSALRPQSFAASLPDEFVHSGPDCPDNDEPPGFIWGVRWTNVDLVTYMADGERARYWTDRLGRPMHEVLIETNVFTLLLVFADLRHAYLGTEESPGVLPPKSYPVPLRAEDATSDGAVH